MKKSILLITALSLLSLPLSAQIAGSGQNTGTLVCPNNNRINLLCMAINTHLPESSNTSPNLYAYQTIILNAACADPLNDAEDEVRRKVQIFWEKFQDELVCDLATFNVANGNLLKYGVNRGFNDFVHDVTNVWQVNLNRVDHSDERTVLDYIRDERDSLQGTAIGRRLSEYHEQFRAAGAKYKSEL